MSEVITMYKLLYIDLCQSLLILYKPLWIMGLRKELTKSILPLAS